MSVKRQIVKCIYTFLTNLTPVFDKVTHFLPKFDSIFDGRKGKKRRQVKFRF